MKEADNSSILQDVQAIIGLSRALRRTTSSTTHAICSFTKAMNNTERLPPFLSSPFFFEEMNHRLESRGRRNTELLSTEK